MFKTYQDFNIRFRSVFEGYQALAEDASGRVAKVEFRQPFNRRQTEDIRSQLGLPRFRPRGTNEQTLAVSRDFGSRLFEAVFVRELLGCFRRSLDSAEDRGQGVRIRLILDDAPELGDLPWEYLHDGRRFLATSTKTPVVRSIELPEAIPPLAVKPPLKMLIGLASPEDFPKLKVDQEVLRLRSALASLEDKGLLEISCIERISRQSLQRHLRTQAPHILHFVGHGAFVSDDDLGYLIFEDEHGHGDPVSGDDLATLIHDHSSIRLVLINACEGARSSLKDPFAGVAQNLLLQGTPAVIAMQAAIEDDVAITFADEFYRAIADGYPVDASLTEARKKIAGQGKLEWGGAVLYLRALDGVIFDFAARKSRAIVKTLVPFLALLFASSSIPLSEPLDPQPSSISLDSEIAIISDRKDLGLFLRSRLKSLSREASVYADLKYAKRALASSRIRPLVLQLSSQERMGSVRVGQTKLSTCTVSVELSSVEIPSGKVLRGAWASEVSPSCAQAWAKLKPALPGIVLRLIESRKSA